jgi:hypothetical protein
MATVKVKLECDDCGSELTIGTFDEVNNVVCLEPCEQCIIKKANKLYDEAKVTLKEKFDIMIGEV